MLSNAATRLLRTQSCIVAVGALVAATAVCVTPRTAAADSLDNGVRDPTAAPDNIGGRSRNLAVSSNLSYFGVRATHDLSRYGYEGWAALLQYETLVETASTPSERAALGSRDSYLGIRGPFGAVKLGKSDTPYKRSTSLFDPFRNTVGDYNSIMGNTGGDARAEFDARLPHSIWYESPTIGGFQFSALRSEERR